MAKKLELWAVVVGDGFPGYTPYIARIAIPPNLLAAYAHRKDAREMRRGFANPKQAKVLKFVLQRSAHRRAAKGKKI
jgi:hypothetical protein